MTTVEQRAREIGEYAKAYYEIQVEEAGLSAHEAGHRTGRAVAFVFGPPRSPETDDLAWEDFDFAEYRHQRPRRTRLDWTLLIVKSVTWRLISTGLLFLIAWWMTGSASLGGAVALVHMVVTVVIYVPHDLVWERIVNRVEARRSKGSPRG